jgi:DNA-binding MarR family transcriptional regulator
MEPFVAVEGKCMDAAEVGQRTRALLREGAGIGAALAERLPLHATDRRALRLLDALAGEVLTHGRLAERLGLSPAATTALVDRLSAAGVVERVRDLPDRRQVRLQLTATSQRFGEELLVPWARRIDAAAARLTPQEAAALSRFLEEVLADEAG